METRCVNLDKLKNKPAEVQNRYLEYLQNNNYYFLYGGFLDQNPELLTEDELLEREDEVREWVMGEGINTDYGIEAELQNRFWVYVTPPVI